MVAEIPKEWQIQPKRIKLMDTTGKKHREIYNMPSLVLKEVLKNSNDPAMKLLDHVMEHTTATNEVYNDVLLNVLEVEKKSNVEVLKEIFRNDIKTDTEDVKKYKSVKEMIGLLVFAAILIGFLFYIK